MEPETKKRKIDELDVAKPVVTALFFSQALKYDWLLTQGLLVCEFEDKSTAIAFYEATKEDNLMDAILRWGVCTKFLCDGEGKLNTTEFVKVWQDLRTVQQKANWLSRKFGKFLDTASHWKVVKPTEFVECEIAFPVYKLEQ